MAYYEGIINKAKTSSFRQNKPKWMRSKWRRERDSNSCEPKDGKTENNDYRAAADARFIDKVNLYFSL
jgi:hypothetical protein